jgi:hypothetical protein
MIDVLVAEERLWLYIFRAPRTCAVYDCDCAIPNEKYTVRHYS